MVEILHPHAHAVEAQLGEQFHRIEIHLARIDLDRILTIGHQRETRAHRLHQLPHLVVRQKGGRAPAKVQLGHLPAATQMARLQANFLVKIFQVFGRTPVILGDDLVTGAVIADRVTERDVEV